MTERDVFSEVSQKIFEWSRDPIYLIEPLRIAARRKLPVPEWLLQEIEKILLEKRADRPGRGERSFEEKDRQYWVDLVRSETVKLLLEAGTPYLEVFEAASGVLEGTPVSGSADTIRRSHRIAGKKSDAKQKGLRQALGLPPSQEFEGGGT
jgi:hypothetical protein